MVLMPSCTVPTSSKMPLTVCMIQPDMFWMRITSPVARVIAPTLTASRLHSHSDSAQVPVISRPLSTISEVSIAVVTRVCARCFSASSAMESRT